MNHLSCSRALLVRQQQKKAEIIQRYDRFKDYSDSDRHDDILVGHDGFRFRFVVCSFVLEDRVAGMAYVRLDLSSTRRRQGARNRTKRTTEQLVEKVWLGCVTCVDN